MKKIIFFTMILIYISTIFTLETEPSQVVGYVAVEANANDWTSLSMPFNANERNISSIFSDVTATPFIDGNSNPVWSDQIVEVDGATTWYNSTSNIWEGDGVLDTSKVYNVITRTENSTIYLCGKVDSNTVVNYPDMPANFSSYIGFREAGVVAVQNLALLEAGFTGASTADSSDQIQEIGGTFAWYNTDTNSWEPQDFSINPGKAYIIEVKAGHSGLSNYSYPNLTRNRRINLRNNSSSLKLSKNGK